MKRKSVKIRLHLLYLDRTDRDYMNVMGLYLLEKAQIRPSHGTGGFNITFKILSMGLWLNPKPRCSRRQDQHQAVQSPKMWVVRGTTSRKKKTSEERVWSMLPYSVQCVYNVARSKGRRRRRRKSV